MLYNFAYRSHQLYYMFGFLFLVFIILLITCSEATILLCYFQLCSEVRGSGGRVTHFSASGIARGSAGTLGNQVTCCSLALSFVFRITTGGGGRSSPVALRPCTCSSMPCTTLQLTCTLLASHPSSCTLATH